MMNPSFTTNWWLWWTQACMMGLSGWESKHGGTQEGWHGLPMYDCTFFINCKCFLGGVLICMTARMVGIGTIRLCLEWFFGRVWCSAGLGGWWSQIHKEWHGRRGAAHAKVTFASVWGPPTCPPNGPIYLHSQCPFIEIQCSSRARAPYLPLGLWPNSLKCMAATCTKVFFIQGPKPLHVCGSNSELDNARVTAH